MACITCQKHAMVLVEIICEALTDTVCAPPKHAFEVHFIWREDALCGRLQVSEGNGLGMRASRKLNVEAHELPAFARDDEQVARAGVDGAFATDVREGGRWVDVHDAPDGVGGVA